VRRRREVDATRRHDVNSGTHSKTERDGEDLLQAAGLPRYAHTALTAFARQCLQAVGFDEQDAAILSDGLEDGQLRSPVHSNQGYTRVAVYVKRVQAGGLAPRPRLRTIQDAPAMALIDGDRGAGQVVGYRAMALAIDKGKAGGIGAVGVRNSNHFGASGYYALMAAQQDCVGFAFTNASPEMAPWGGKTALCATNPWSIAVPAGRNLPVVLDVSCATASRGQIPWRTARGEPIPEGWYLDRNGDATTDPTEAFNGLVLPFGGYKGYGIAVMAEMITGVLTGAAFGADVGSPRQFDRPADVSHLFMVLDPARWQPIDQFKRRVDDYVQALRDDAKPGGRVYVPGEIEWLRREEQLRHGCALRHEVEAALSALGKELDVEFPAAIAR
jgi:LDH2 family malate/lactate/ureidoglycolate dehydrogenase